MSYMPIEGEEHAVAIGAAMATAIVMTTVTPTTATVDVTVTTIGTTIGTTTGTTVIMAMTATTAIAIKVIGIIGVEATVTTAIGDRDREIFMFMRALARMWHFLAD